MSTQPLDDRTIRLTSPQQVAASIPYEFGFLPTESLVGVFFDMDGRVLVTVRIDMPADISPGDVVERFLACCERAIAQDAWGVAVVAYPATEVPDVEVCEQLTVVVDAAARVGLTVTGPGFVRNSMWFPHHCDGGDAEPDSGTQALVGACQWINEGAAYLPTREDLAATIVGDPTDLTLAVGQAIANATRAGEDPTRTADRRRQIEDLLFKFATNAMRDARLARRGVEQQIEAASMAAIAIGLRDRRVREPFLWRMAKYSKSKGHPLTQFRDVLAAMSFLTRNCPKEVAAPLAATTAALAWQGGDGALARIAAEHALSCDDTNVLGRLVLQAVAGGVPPSAWTTLMESLSLSSLRATRGR